MTEDVRNVGLFGGSFNPPHVCHTLATLWALQTQGLDEVWWIPTYQHAFGKDLVSFEHRLSMCERATRALGQVKIQDIERRMGGESRTIDTVEVLLRENPGHRFSLIVGTDILKETHKWKRWDELMELVDLVVVGRKGHLDALDSEFSLPAVSSTGLRASLRGDGEVDVESWMVRDVLTYAREHELYTS